MLLALCTACPAAAQQVGEPAAEDATAPRLWRWMDDEKPPFHDWHQDTALQQQAYATAYDAMHAALGVEFTEPVEVCIVPARYFPFCGMEFGAKTGELRYAKVEFKARDWLGLRRAEERGQPIDPERDPDDSPVHRADGGYYPRIPSLKFKGQVWLRPDQSAEALVAPLRHELVHAMQDRTYPFADWLVADGLTLDGHTARSAVMEGTAMVLANADELSGAAHRRDEAGAQLSDGMLRGTWETRRNYFTHVVGGQVVEGLRQHASTPREWLDMLFSRPPKSSSQFLHPELYVLDGTSEAPAGHSSFDAMVQRLDAALSRRGTAWDRTRAGEYFLLSLLVELGTDGAEALELSSRWRDDQLISIGTKRDASLTASVWCLDSEEHASKLASVLEAALARRGLARAAGEPDAPPPEEWRLYTSADPGLPHALLDHDGHAVVYVAGTGLSALAEDWQAGN